MAIAVIYLYLGGGSERDAQVAAIAIFYSIRNEERKKEKKSLDKKKWTVFPVLPK